MKKRQSELPMRAYKYVAYPTKAQQEQLWKHSCRLNGLYNDFLKQRKDNPNIKKKQQSASIKEIRPKDDTLKEIYCQVVHNSIHDRVDMAWQSYWKQLKQTGAEAKSNPRSAKKYAKMKERGMPSFRSMRYCGFYSLFYHQSGFKVVGNSVTFNPYGKIKFNKHREYDGKIKQIHINCERDKWYLIIICECEPKAEEEKPEVGIDIGVKNIVATSDGEIIKNATHGKYFRKKIDKLKSNRDALLRQGKSGKEQSRRWKYLSRTIKKLEGVKIRKINDFLHKVSKNLADKYSLIYCEDLKIKKMTENNKNRRAKGKEKTVNDTQSAYNRSMLDSCLHRLIGFLAYKTKIKKVNPFNTSKRCNKCGKIHEDMKVSDRRMICECGNDEDRDVNAAKNIYCLGRACQNGQDSTCIIGKENNQTDKNEMLAKKDVSPCGVTTKDGAVEIDKIN